MQNLRATFPDGVYFPNWDDELRKSFCRETELLFESVMRGDRSVVDLLTADYTFLNERLAQHYGILGVMARNSAASRWDRSWITEGPV